MTSDNISARIIADSINPYEVRLVSAIWRYPRYIHSEVMTHRSFSRNAASSRAIPLKKMIFAVRDKPACPEFWGKNQKGMQAAEELTSDYRRIALDVWLSAMAEAADYAEVLDQVGVLKPEYCEIARARIGGAAPLFSREEVAG